MDIILQTKTMLARSRARGATLRDIADAGKGSFGFEWLRKFAYGHIESPSVVRIQSLHSTLSRLKSARGAK
jgi:hypothetical protein